MVSPVTCAQGARYHHQYAFSLSANVLTPDYGTRTLYIFVLMDEDLVYRVTLNLLCKY